VEKAVSMVTRNIAEKAPRDGVAIVIRVPGPPYAEDAMLAWEWMLDPPSEYRRAVVEAL
jgi:hypothetical protein